MKQLDAFCKRQILKDLQKSSRAIVLHLAKVDLLYMVDPPSRHWLAK